MRYNITRMQTRLPHSHTSRSLSLRIPHPVSASRPPAVSTIMATFRLGASCAQKSWGRGARVAAPRYHYMPLIAVTLGQSEATSALLLGRHRRRIHILARLSDQGLTRFVRAGAGLPRWAAVSLCYAPHCAVNVLASASPRRFRASVATRLEAHGTTLR